MDDAVKALSDQLIGGVAGDLAERPVDQQPAPLGVQQARADRRRLEDLLEAFGAPRGDQIGVAAGGDVQNTATPPTTLCRPGRRRAVPAERSRVDDQAMALVGGPDLPCAGLAFERRAEQRLDALPEAGGEGVGEVAALLAEVGVAHPGDRLTGGQDEAELTVEDDHQCLGELVQRRGGRVIGARQQLFSLRPGSHRGVHGPCIG